MLSTLAHTDDPGCAEQVLETLDALASWDEDADGRLAEILEAALPAAVRARMEELMRTGKYEYADSIAAALVERGAPPMCRVISTNAGLDGREVLLVDVFAQVVGYGCGTAAVLCARAPRLLRGGDAEGPVHSHEARWLTCHCSWRASGATLRGAQANARCVRRTHITSRQESMANRTGSDTDAEAIAAALDAAHERAREAYASKDAGAYLDMFHPDLEYTQLDGKTIGLDQLAGDVRLQLSRMHAASTTYHRESLSVGEGRATEVLQQEATYEVRALHILRRAWTFRRKGRYEWVHAHTDWKLRRVEVLSEVVVASRTWLSLA